MIKLKKYRWLLIGILFILSVGVVSCEYLENNAKIRVGVLGDYSTSSSTASVDSFRAIEVALNELDPMNERYELIRFDFPQYVGEEELINKIRHEEIEVILGPSTSSQYIAIESALQVLDIPVFLLSVSTNRVHNKKDHIFRLNNDISIHSNAMAYTVNQYSMSKRCTIYYTEHNSSFSKTLATMIMKNLEKLEILDNIDSIQVGNLEDKGTRDLLSRRLDSDIVVVIAGPGTAGTIGQMVAMNNPDTSLLFSSWGKSKSTLEHLSSVVNPMYVLSQPEPYDMDVYKQFENKIIKGHKINLNSFSISGYETTYFMDWVLNKTRKTDKDKVATLVNNLEKYTTSFNHYYFNGYGDGARGYGLYKIENSRYELVEPMIDLE